MLNRICSVLLLKRDESGNSIEALLIRRNFAAGKATYAILTLSSYQTLGSSDRHRVSRRYIHIQVLL